MSYGELNGPDLDMIEARAQRDAARIAAELGKDVVKGEFEFCPDCPLLNTVVPEEITTAQMGVLSVLQSRPEFSGAIFAGEFSLPDGRRTKMMEFNRYPGNMLTGSMYYHAIGVAKQKTQECSGPNTSFRFLGKWAFKSCGALREYPFRGIESLRPKED